MRKKHKKESPIYILDYFEDITKDGLAIQSIFYSSNNFEFKYLFDDESEN